MTRNRGGFAICAQFRPEGDLDSLVRARAHGASASENDSALRHEVTDSLYGRSVGGSEVALIARLWDFLPQIAFALAWAGAVILFSHSVVAAATEGI